MDTEAPTESAGPGPEPGGGDASPVAVAGELTPELYRRAVKLGGRYQRAVALLPAIAVLALLLRLLGTPWDAVTPILVLAAVLGLAFWLVPALATWRFRTSRRPEDYRFRGEARPDGIRLQAEYGSSDRPWQAFYRYRASRDLLLLYITWNQFVLLAREFVATEADWERLCRWATAVVPARPRDAGRWLRVLLWAALFAVLLLFFWSLVW